MHQVVFFLVTYVMPMVGLSTTYCHLGSVLWANDSLMASKQERRRLAKMFIVVLIVFGVCWLPYHVYFLYTYYHAVRTAQNFFDYPI